MIFRRLGIWWPVSAWYRKRRGCKGNYRRSMGGTSLKLPPTERGRD